MRPECNKPLIQFETMAIIAMCGLLFIAAFRNGPSAMVHPRDDPVFSHRHHSPLRTVCKSLARGFKEIAQKAT